MPTLDQTEIESRLQEFPEWGLNDDGTKLITEAEFEDFKQALDFINTVGEIAERLQHHPDILLFDYRYVQLSISTHTAQGITDKDFEFVAEIDELFEEHADHEGHDHDENDSEEEVMI